MTKKILIKDYYNCINLSVWQKKDHLHLHPSQVKQKYQLQVKLQKGVTFP